MPKFNSKLNILFLIILFFGIFGLASSSEAANRYVRQGATGLANGTDWTNAYTALPATLTRGDTYYIADGTYAGYRFDDTLSGSTLVTIKKATIADHGTNTGWNDTYGDDQAEFGYTYFGNDSVNTGYYLIDGVTGGGPTNWTGNLGFKFSRINARAESSTKSNITIKHSDIDGGASTSNGNRPIDMSQINTLTISYSYIHNAGDDVITMLSTSNFTVEYSKFAFSYESATYHPDLVQGYGGPYSNIIFRYNYIYDVDGTYLWGVHDNNTANGYEIYGNIIVFTNRPSNTSDGIVGDLNGNGTINNLKFYNNTITGDFNYNVGFGPIVGSNNVAYNNLWVKLSGTGGFGSISSVTHNYNSFYNLTHSGEENRSGNPFTNSGNENFTLSGVTTAGTTLPNPYNVDMFGNVRGADGTWDRGAYEYLASGPPTTDTVSPSIPANLIATPVSSSQINLSWNASTDNIGVAGYRVYRGGVQIATSQTTSYQNIGLTASTTYSYNVLAYDAAGNNSSQSSSVSAITQSSSTPPIGNLLLNSNFESGFTSGLANNWNILTDGSVGYAISQDTGYQGLAQKIDISSPGSWGLFYYQTPSFQLNQFYNWSFWYKTQGTGSLWAQITNAPQTQTVYLESLPPTNNQWTYKTITFQYTNPLADELRFSSNSTGSYWIDNVQLAVASSVDTTPPSAPTNLQVQ